MSQRTARGPMLPLPRNGIRPAGVGVPQDVRDCMAADVLARAGSVPTIGKRALRLPVMAWQTVTGYGVGCPIIPGARAEGSTLEAANNALAQQVGRWIAIHGARAVPDGARMGALEMEADADPHPAVVASQNRRQDERDALLTQARDTCARLAASDPDAAAVLAKLLPLVPAAV